MILRNYNVSVNSSCFLILIWNEMYSLFQTIFIWELVSLFDFIVPMLQPICPSAFLTGISYIYKPIFIPIKIYSLFISCNELRIIFPFSWFADISGRTEKNVCKSCLTEISQWMQHTASNVKASNFSPNRPWFVWLLDFQFILSVLIKVFGIFYSLMWDFIMQSEHCSSYSK